MNKKIVLVSVVLFTSLTLTSCLKDYDCTCYSRYYQNGQVVNSFSNTTNISEPNRTDADAACAENNQNTLANGNGYTSDCKIEE